MVSPLYWKNNSLYILDQRKLPDKEVWIKCSNYRHVAKTIKEMAVRGAPAIGITAAYGIVLAAKNKKLKKAYDEFAKTRPTAVNLFWAIERMKKKAEKNSSWKELLKEARKIHKEDENLCKKIGYFGSKLIKKGTNILTHCNAGSLATSKWGTALGVIRSARDKINIVWVDETRPYLQGARLTAWELEKEKIPYKIICDNMAGFLMSQKKVDAVIVGADRIASNGDIANKIGTYTLAVLCGYHKIPFYVAAPYSTFDFKIKTGKQIPIEERDEKEIKLIRGKIITPRKAKVFNPAFDITPHKLISAIITEKGIIYNPDRRKISKFYEGVRK